MAAQKTWIVNEDPAIVTAPFPDGYWQADVRFEAFLQTLEQRGLKPEHIAGVLMVTDWEKHGLPRDVIKNAFLVSGMYQTWPRT